jgi:hypothetical protein
MCERGGGTRIMGGSGVYKLRGGGEGVHNGWREEGNRIMMGGRRVTE